MGGTCGHFYWALTGTLDLTCQVELLTLKCEHVLE